MQPDDTNVSRSAMRPTHITNGYSEPFHWTYNGRSVKLNIHIHLMSTLRMHRAAYHRCTLRTKLYAISFIQG
jgi:hypothetical protein